MTKNRRHYLKVYPKAERIEAEEGVSRIRRLFSCRKYWTFVVIGKSGSSNVAKVLKKFYTGKAAENLLHPEVMVIPDCGQHFPAGLTLIFLDKNGCSRDALIGALGGIVLGVGEDPDADIVFFPETTVDQLQAFNAIFSDPVHDRARNTRNMN